MATRRARPQPGRRRTARRNQASAWPLLVGIVAALITLWAWLSYLPWSFGTPEARRPLSFAEARASNAAVPFVQGGLLPAKRFVFHGGRAARAQAVDCLATAALYEAGKDRRGQKAVVQVILNRVRLPGFPKTICGVVYQGAHRTTGCQFSFTCDGSLVRRTEHAGWEQARTNARRAIAGYVFSPVGRASHYHTDWVVPYWRPSLDKIAQIDSHIFYIRH